MRSYAARLASGRSSNVGADKGCMMRRFFLIVIAAIPTCASAAVDASAAYLKCVEMREPIANAHQASAADILRKHDQELDSLISEFLADSQADADKIKYFEQSRQSIRAYHQVDDAEAQLVDGIVESLLNPAGQDDEDFRCPRKGDTKRWSKDNLKTLSSVLTEVRDDVMDRIGFESMEEGEGLAIIAFYAYGHVSSARINRLGGLTGSFEFEPIGNGEFIHIFKLRAGDYEWDRVRQELWFNTTYVFDIARREMRFSVLPGKLNITGVFVYEANGNYASTSLSDRPAIVLRMIEQRFPELSDNFEFANGLVPEDKFIDVYLAEKRTFDQETKSAN